MIYLNNCLQSINKYFYTKKVCSNLFIDININKCMPTLLFKFIHRIKEVITYSYFLFYHQMNTYTTILWICIILI